MFENIPIMRVAGSMARHATHGQRIVSQNIANADTPSYKAKGFSKFSDSMKSYESDSEVRVTRSGHAGSASTDGKPWKIVENNFSLKPNGNTVSIEEQMMISIEMERQHSRALTVYQHSVDLLKMSIGRGR
ncbi:flagellar basal-body rod protein FlgB [Litoreibacter meonggei]|uniref:Flagellar basal-body rod protein FlgB n=1 Tax=Litoreibacter meonggei TaxID=1049199 RepID=A0A497VLW2_9RHOB|nr:FlgB family protein [Litoreibacter meonggei]RLJ41195.1 flagellar basal-body rod protein FlgB [Litoreibacter meonggei]